MSDRRNLGVGTKSSNTNYSSVTADGAVRPLNPQLCEGGAYVFDIAFSGL